MNVNVSTKNNTTTFGNISMGTCFEYGDTIYMKAKSQNSTLYGIDIYDYENGGVHTPLSRYLILQ